MKNAPNRTFDVAVCAADSAFSSPPTVRVLGFDTLAD